MKDNDYTLHQLITNEEFIRWVKYPDPVLDVYWQRWIDQGYGRAALVDETRTMVLLMNFPQEKMASAQKAALKKRIQQSPDSNTTSHEFTAHPPLEASDASGANWIRYAAVFAGILLSSIFLYFYLSSDAIVYQTKYGELATYTLPDSSVVTMNANSRLTYQFDGKREVWIKGEAYFQVKKLKNGKQEVPFIVHAEKLDVAVLGTEFNVNTRRGTISVTLHEGKVALKTPDAKVAGATMKPGEQAVLKPGSQLNLQKVNTALFTSWKDEKLIFDRTPLQEIALVIEDIYGYQVVIQDQNLQKREFTGTLPSGNVNLFWLCWKKFLIPILKNRMTGL
jgi:transmembrane sensor